VSLPLLPDWLLNMLRAKPSARFEMPPKVEAGQRNDMLFRLGRSLRARGLSEGEIISTLAVVNAQRCEPPLEADEVWKIGHNAASAPNQPGFRNGSTNGASSAAGGVFVVADWPEPEELGGELLPVPSLKESLIPEPLRGWIVDAAERVQCPPDYFAVAALVAAAQLVGRRIAIRPKQHDTWYEHANLWGAIVAPPGFAKSPAIQEAFRPTFRLESEARRQYEDAKRAAEVDREIAESNKTIIRNLRRESLPRASVNGSLGSL
jgi:hypothetical protein